MGTCPRIEIERVSAIDAATEIALLRAATAREPRNVSLLSRLAGQLLVQGRYEDVIELLEGQLDRLDFDCSMALAKACFFIQPRSRRHAELSLRSTELALAATTDDSLRAFALAEQGKALHDLGREDEAALALRQAFDLDPRGPAPFKRLIQSLLRKKAFAELIGITDQLLDQRVVRTDLLAARVLALAAVGRISEARELDGFGRFAVSAPLDLPSGWADIAALNFAVSREVHHNPELRFGRVGTASQHSWRVDRPAMGDTPAINALLGAIAAQAARMIEALPDANHPWLHARPKALKLKCWTVLTRAAGFERWHFHPEGWLSGGYYISVPETVGESDSKAGCFAAGLPPSDIGAEASALFGEQHVRPYPGMLSLFPSHAHHSTYPHGTDAERACLAFDLCPL